MLPQLYHAHYSRYREDLPFWMELAARQGDPILELGCGTGRLTLPLATAGHDLVGLDRDGEMLAVCAAELSSDLNLRVHLIQADMQAYCFQQKFALIFLPCNTISTLTSVERRLVFETARRHLLPGGLFAASQINPAALLEIDPEGPAELEDVFSNPETGLPVQVFSSWQRSDRGVQIFWHYDQLFPEGRIERATLSAWHDVAGPEEYGAELQEAGLELAQSFGDFDGSPFSPDAPYFIWTASLR